MTTIIKVLALFALSGLAAGASDCEDLPCSHKCVLVAGQAKCTCPEDMYLGQDQKTCQVPVSILLAMFRGIKQLTEKGKDNDMRLAVPIATKTFDFNFERKDLYASSNNSILRYKLTSNDEPPKPVVTLDSSATSLAVDWVKHDLYWISSQRSMLEAATVTGEGRRTVLTFEDVIARARPGQPKPLQADWHSLLVDPYVGKLFWVGGGGVYRADLNGGSLQAGLGGWREVVAVALDTRNQLIYTLDKSQYIRRCRYDGSQPEQVGNVPRQGATIYGLAVLGNTVYWQSSHNAESLYKAEVPPSGTIGEVNIYLVEELNQIVYAMKIYHPDVQKTVK